MRCSKCKGKIQATRKVYLTLDNSQFEETGHGDDFSIYCENDCFTHETNGIIDVEAPDDLLPGLRMAGTIEYGEPQ